jgi:hypothetical protein
MHGMRNQTSIEIPVGSVAEIPVKPGRKMEWTGKADRVVNHREGTIVKKNVRVNQTGEEKPGRHTNNRPCFINTDMLPGFMMNGYFISYIQ